MTALLLQFALSVAFNIAAYVAMPKGPMWRKILASLLCATAASATVYGRCR